MHTQQRIIRRNERIISYEQKEKGNAEPKWHKISKTFNIFHTSYSLETNMN